MAITQISTPTNENAALGQGLEDDAQCYPSLSRGVCLIQKAQRRQRKAKDTASPPVITSHPKSIVQPFLQNLMLR